jgi:hypothetical protein
MEPFELLEILVSALNKRNIPYLVTGSIASTFHGEPRFTNDIDIVVELRTLDVEFLASAFSGKEFYLDAESAHDAIRRKSMFNIIHSISGFKLDLIISKDTDFEKSRFSRVQEMLIRPDFIVKVASAEDVIIKKLEFYKLGKSEKHLRDIVGMMKISAEKIDETYLKRWIQKLDLTKEWAIIEKRL